PCACPLLVKTGVLAWPGCFAYCSMKTQRPLRRRQAMDLDLLRQFGVLARTGSLELAGEQLHLSASAVSRSMRRLEAALDTALFDRHGRALQLNAAGRRLLEESLPLLAQAERIAGSFKGTGAGLRCRVAGPARLHAHFARVPLQK